jgi:hypothetical protein
MMPRFSPSGYREFLATLLARQYSFGPFQEEFFNRPALACVLRHDVDADPEAALRLARIESSLGISATYFVMLRSPVYNLFSRANHLLIEEIMRLGHRLGLHFDQGFRGSSEVDEQVACEASILKNNFGQTIEVVSFHQPNAAIIAGAIGVKGFVNTYDRNALRHFRYFSDSNMVWRGEEFAHCVSDGQSLQLNFHPLWWVDETPGLTTTDLWNQALIRNIERAQDQLTSTERAYGPRRTLRFDA